MMRSKWLGPTVAILLAALVAGCTGGDGGCWLCGKSKNSSAVTDPSAESTTGSSASDAQTTDSSDGHLVALKADAEWGTVSGQVVWGGDEAPKPVEIDPGDNPDKAFCTGKGKIFEEKWVVNKENKGIRWVFVWLQPEGSGPMPIHPDLKKPAKDQVVIDQPCCQFVDHAFAMRAGQVLVAKNSAAVAHNVKWFNKDNGEGNVLIPAGGSLKLMTVKASARPMSLECNIHTWMHAWVRVFDHPYYAITDADGKFEIKMAPAGKYRLVVWHEEGWGPGGKEGNEITIKENTDAGKIVINPSK